MSVAPCQGLPRRRRSPITAEKSAFLIDFSDANGLRTNEERRPGAHAELTMRCSQWSSLSNGADADHQDGRRSLWQGFTVLYHSKYKTHKVQYSTVVDRSGPTLFAATLRLRHALIVSTRVQIASFPKDLQSETSESSLLSYHGTIQLRTQYDTIPLERDKAKRPLDKYVNSEHSNLPAQTKKDSSPPHCRLSHEYKPRSLWPG